MGTNAVMAGLRRGEILALQWDDIDFDHHTIHVKHSLQYTKENGYVLKTPKTKTSTRSLSVDPGLMEDLKKYKSQKNKERIQTGDLWKGGQYFFVFSSELGKPYYPSVPGTWWKRFIKRTGLKYIRFHDLRHSHATYLIENNVHAKVISDRLGHANIKTTMDIYGHFIKKADEEAGSLFSKLRKPEHSDTKKA